MKVINVDKNGKIIKDLSEITLDKVLSEELRTLMIEGRKEECQSDSIKRVIY